MKYGATITAGVPGCYLLADAVAGLLERRYMKSAFPLPPLKFLLMLTVAVVGCLLPVKLATARALEASRHRTMLWAALVGLSAACFLVMVLADGFAPVHLGMAGFALCLAMAGSFAVEFARNRHRVSDRRRRAIESFGLGSEGTITLPPKRPRPLPAAG